jgi:hypothetical protein
MTCQFLTEHVQVGGVRFQRDREAASVEIGFRSRYGA